MVAKVVSCSGNFRFISSDANPPPEAAAAAAMEGFVPDTSWYGVRLRGGGGGRLASGVGWGLRTWRWAVIDTWLRIFLSWPRALEGGPIEALRSCSGGFSSFSATWGKIVFLCVRGSHSTVWGKKCFFDCILLKLPNFLNVNHQVSRKMPYISWDVPFFIRYVSFLVSRKRSRLPFSSNVSFFRFRRNACRLLRGESCFSHLARYVFSFARCVSSLKGRVTFPATYFSFFARIRYVL